MILKLLCVKLAVYTKFSLIRLFYPRYHSTQHNNTIVSKELSCALCAQPSWGAVAVSRDRYIAGKASYYEVLEAQQQLFPAENNLAQTQLNRLTAVIQLYKALGGG